MLSIVNVLLKDRFAPRFYVAAATDNMSLQKARVLEDSLVQHGEVYLLHIFIYLFSQNAILFSKSILSSCLARFFMFPCHVQWFEHKTFMYFLFSFYLLIMLCQNEFGKINRCPLLVLSYMHCRRSCYIFSFLTLWFLVVVKELMVLVL